MAGLHTLNRPSHFNIFLCCHMVRSNVMMVSWLSIPSFYLVGLLSLIDVVIVVLLTIQCHSVRVEYHHASEAFLSPVFWRLKTCSLFLSVLMYICAEASCLVWLNLMKNNVLCLLYYLNTSLNVDCWYKQGQEHRNQWKGNREGTGKT